MTKEEVEKLNQLIEDIVEKHNIDYEAATKLLLAELGV